MHYRPFSFNKNESIPTITTKIPEFYNIIGQYLDFSKMDTLRLNRMYNCCMYTLAGIIFTVLIFCKKHKMDQNSLIDFLNPHPHPSLAGPLTLLDQCAFEYASICGMIQASSDDADWVHTKSSVGSEDHTLLGQCRGCIVSLLKSQLLTGVSLDIMKEISKKKLYALITWLIFDFLDAGYFMHFNTMVGKPGASALLESRTLYPKRKLQCLQFFYKMTGNTEDRLVIWVKMDDGTGTVRKMQKIHTFYGMCWMLYLWMMYFTAATSSFSVNTLHLGKYKFQYLFSCSVKFK